ncbi:hypothetical protein Poli38472_013720 [Pythium oligandrum]|uniref:Uncharacterized protein n=1 Tax=Pythium oligandrum TaxID=41045 RepID=A0A8K1CFJ4_PYTOL|nr:hypothetical protein Poli38472_013720 [Pythium oligandrum]|eukprot:TMW61257.1 hypothetical protein Poli38472_013720 [Pythium oligandrum]
MPMDDAAFAALLEPWWREFPSQSLKIAVKSEPSDFYERYYALNLTLTDRVELWRRQYDAVEILLLASLVKPPKFKEMMWKMCGSMGGRSSECFDPESVMPCRFDVTVIPKGDRSRWYSGALEELFSFPTERSERFEETRAALVAQRSEKGLALDQVAIPVSVLLYFQDEQSIIQAIDHLVDLQRQRLKDTTHFYPFALEQVSVTVTRSPVSMELAEAINRFKATPGLQLGNLWHCGFQWDPVAPTIGARRKAVWRWATTATAVPNHRTIVPQDVVHPPGDQLSRSDTVKCHDPCPEHFLAVCSSLMYASHVNKLVIGLDSSLDSSSSGLKWCWLFYALFNSASCHSVAELRIEASEIRMDDIVRVRNLIRSPRPLEMLVNPVYEENTMSKRLDSSPTQPSQVVLQDGAMIYLDNARSEEPLTLSSGQQTFNVIHALDDGYEIMVPGYGQCWVDHQGVATEIPPSEENATNQWRLTTHSIAKLSIRVDCTGLEDQEGGIRVLLKLIGTPLLHLSICVPYDLLHHSYFDLAWTYCPSLISLSFLRTNVDSFDDVMEAYATGRCRVSELAMEECRVRDPASTFDFVHALADPSTTLAKTLRQLRVSFMNESEEVVIEDELLETLYSMLATNEQLRFLATTVSSDQFDRFNSRFDVFRGQPIRYLVSLSAKCAFLSVVKHAQLAEDGKNSATQAIGLVDSLVLSKIFFYASEPASRTVVLHTID